MAAIKVKDVMGATHLTVSRGVVGRGASSIA